MATQVQFRRGTTTQNNAFTGAIGEITYDTEAKTLRLHDGSTSGGGAVVATLAGTQTITNKTLSTNSVWQGTAVGLAYGGTNASLTAAAGGVLYSGASALAISAAGTSGQVLTSAGSSAPTWTSQSSLTVGTATTATTATNISGGSAGYLMYQVDTNQTGFIAPGLTGYLLRSTGASTAPDWVAANLTIGSTSVALGSTVTSFSGFTALDATSGATSFFATPTSPGIFAGATALTVGYTGTASSTTNISTGSVGSGNTKTINIGTGGAAGSTTNINLGDSDGGTVTVNKDLVVTGDLTVNGTTTTINSTTLDVDDINITVAKGAANAAAANGAGLTVDGASATMLYTSATDSWNFNKPIINSVTSFTQVASGTTAQRPGSAAVGMVRYNSDISSFEGYASGAWSSLGGVKSVDGYTYIIAETSAGASNGDLDFYAENGAGNAATQIGQWNRTNLKDYTGTLVGTQTTQNVFNATATTVNAFGAATSLTIGATSGTATIRNSTVSITNNATVGGTLGVSGATTVTGGSVLVRAASTQDGIELRGRAGGTGNWEAILTPTTLTADRTFTFPDVSGTVVTTGDTGTVTSTMIADGTIVNADINASAAIAVSKLAASTISGVTLGNNLNALTIGTGLSGTSYNGSSAVTIALANTAVTAGSYGGSTSIPVLTIDAQGRITAASTSAVSTTISLAGTSGSGSVAGGGTLTFASGNGVTSSVSSSTVTINTPQDLRTSAAPTFNGVTSTDGFFATSNDPIVYTATTVAANVTIPANYNGMSVGPITINNNIVVTIPDGSAWTIV